MGIEPTYPAWKAGVLPLNYTRMINYEIVMPRTGIEPVTRGFSVLCSTNWAIWASWGILWFSCSLLFSDMHYYTKGSCDCQGFFWTFAIFFKTSQLGSYSPRIMQTVTWFYLCFALQISEIRCHYAIVRHLRFQKCPPVNNNVRQT